ncbi:SRPBCC domain-containing protein [Micromonospora sp. M12]
MWESLTNSDQASAWFGYPIGIEPWVGGRYAMGGFENGYAAKIVDLEPARRMSIDWGPVGVTSWELAESGGKTTLTFVQSGFDEANPVRGLEWLGCRAVRAAPLPRGAELAADLARRGGPRPGARASQLTVSP